MVGANVLANIISLPLSYLPSYSESQVLDFLQL